MKHISPLNLVTLGDLNTDVARQALSLRLAQQLGEAYEMEATTFGVFGLPRVRHRATNTALQFIPAGTFAMGFSQEEESQARRLNPNLPSIFARNLAHLRPVLPARVNAFLCSVLPITTRLYQAVAGTSAPGFQFPDGHVMVPFDLAAALARQLGGRLPSEEEWEYACRAGTQTLFVWGEGLCSPKELEQWLISDFPPGYEEHARSNPFGLCGLFCGEWCGTEYRDSHDASAKCFPGEHVVKGGGAMFWPWQDEEWIWCMPAMRMPESGLFPDRQAGFRIVIGL